MGMIRKIASGMQALMRRKRANEELDEELGGFLEMAAEEKMKRGMSRKEAERAVRLERGSCESAKEEVRSAGWEHFVETFGKDLRYGLRVLRKSPGFTIAAVLTLALGIGASTAIFSVVDAVLLRPLPYPHPERILQVMEQAANGHRMSLADLNYEDFRTQNNTIDNLAEHSDWRASVAGGSEPVRENVAIVSSGFFPAMGVEPLRGRRFAADEQKLHGAPAAIVSYAYWQRYLGGAEDFSQFHLSIEGTVYPVVGVMPPSFNFPPGAAVWTPRERTAELTSRTAHNFRAVGRVKDGVTVEQARANLSAIAKRIRAEYGKKVDLTDAYVVPLGEAMVGDVKTALLTLGGAVGLLLLVACANVAGLLIARSSARKKELAVRSALGAGRGRLAQQLLAESLTLALVGGGIGFLIASWAVKLLPAIVPANLPRQEGIAISAPVMLFALGATVAVAIALGLFGAWRAAVGDLQEALSAGSRSDSGTGGGQRLRSALVIGEIATTLVILVGAGLLGRSFVRLIETSPGFQTEHLVTMEFSPPNQWTETFSAPAVVKQAQQLDAVVERLKAMPGAESVGLVGAMPVAQGDDLADGDFLILHGRKAPASFEEWDQMDQSPALVGHAEHCVASEDYFRTMGIPLMRGRMFGAQDGPETQHVAVISEALVRLRWPNQDPIGEQLEFGNMDGVMTPLTIVGIVGDVRARGLDRPPAAIIYTNYRQRGMSTESPTVLMRTTARVAAIVPTARAIFHDEEPDVPVKFSTFDAEMGGWLAERRFLLLLVGVFAAAALALAAIGIYGIVAYSVARRTQEIGIRVALGAQRGDVLRMILGEGARMALIAVVIGIVASAAVTRLMASLLFGVSATDPATFAAVAILLGAVTIVASYVPARRATRVDPIVALRYE
jgi:putative ABC transport system permease protein